MGYASYIIYADDVAAPDVEGYDRALAGLSLGEKIADCQKFNERADAAGISKMLILYMAGGSEISHEVKRIFSWRNRAEKANFLIAQLQSSDTDIVMSSIDLLGVLKEPFTIPYIDAIFNFSDTRLAERIIDALSEMGENVGVATIMKALRSRNKDLLLLAIKRLSRMVEDVSWKVFRPLLQHDAPEIRNEAAFAICIRKSPQSAACLQKAIWSEQDRATKLGMIKHLGTVPGRRLVRPLLYMIVHDKDQKMRLAASRTLDRLQGLLRPGVIYWLRYTPDPAMRAEALFRLGKLGCEVEAHKEFLRRTLRKSQDLQILQACLQALGNIAERTDVDLLIEFLSRDPFTSYNAAFALTKMLRLEDGDRIISIIRSTRSHTTKQIFLKHLTRRRGFSVKPEKLLSTAKACIESEKSINVRYLAFCLLEFAPSPETIEYLLLSYTKTDNAFEMEAIDTALRGLALHHGSDFLALIEACDNSVCRILIRHLPMNMDPAFYKSLAEMLYGKFGGPIKDENIAALFRDIFERLLSLPIAIREFMKLLPDASWRVFFLHILTEHADRNVIRDVEYELIEMLSDEDHEVRALAMMLILSLKDPSVVPRLVSIAERDPRSKLRAAAGYIARTLVKEGII